ncbi:hypothetical protein M433DRAFT_391390 [Acidomyces richmondensis BFW]|nr:hypothetical protein M433DRAFT_391390 [Acidomyces richmondensis BFW]
MSFEQMPMTGVKSVTELCLLGRFLEAIGQLDALEEPAKDVAACVDIYRAAARVYVSWGYPRFAKTNLEKALRLPLDSVTEITRVSLRLHLAYVRIVSCGELDKIDQDERAIKDAQATLSGLVKYQDFDSSSLEMESQVSKINLQAQNFCQRRDSDVKPAITSRLQPLVTAAQTAKRYQDVWTLYEPYCMALEPSDAIKWRDQLLSHDDIPNPLYGLISLDQAKALGDKHSLEKSKFWLSKADTAFRNCQHAYGISEVRRLQLELGFFPSANVLLDLNKIVISYLHSNLPLCVLRAAIYPLTLTLRHGQYDVYFNLHEVFHNVCNLTGLQPQRLLLEVQLIAVLERSGAHHGQVIELGMALYEMSKRLKCWTVQFHIGQILANAHHRIGNDDEAEKMAQNMYDLCIHENLKALSESEWLLARMKTSRRFNSENSQRETYHDSIAWLLKTIDSDISAGEFQIGCEKLCLVANLQFQLSRKASDKDANFILFSSALDRARALSEHLSSDEKVKVRGQCDEILVTFLLSEGKNQPDNEKELKAMKICDSLTEIYESQGLKFHAAMKHHMKALCHTQVYQKLRAGWKDGEEYRRHLAAAEREYQTAARQLGELALLQEVFSCRHLIAHVHFEAWNAKYIDDEFFLDTLRVLEETADSLRRELSVLGSLSALLQKQKFAARKQLEDLYTWSKDVALRSQDVEKAWSWSQKRKARALSDMLGLGPVVPAAVRRAISVDAIAKEMFERLIWLRSSIFHASVTDRAYLRHQIDGLEADMRKMPIFHDSAVLQDVPLNNFTRLKRLHEADTLVNQGRRVIFVDWTAHRGRLLLLTVEAHQPKDTCKLSQLALTISDVRNWMKDNFSTDEQRKSCLQTDEVSNASSALRALDALVSPITDVAREGDLLILSTTEILAALPLHALGVMSDGRKVPLIERNPVAYTQSFSITESCLSKSAERLEDGRSAFIGVFDRGEEAERIYAHIKALAGAIGAESIVGDEATKEAFRTKANETAALHFHGHCRFDATNVLQQSLILAPPKCSTPEDNRQRERENDPMPKAMAQVQSAKDSATLAQCQPVEVEISTAAKGELNLMPESAHVLLSGQVQAMNNVLLSLPESQKRTHFTVEEMFNLVLNAALVVLIACESASQTISVGDEPLGMVAGLLCAGAASVVGAAWPIPSGAGRTFSNAFYQEITQSSGTMIDLAVALQEAVLTVRDNPLFSATYYWGGFGLYGSWIYRRPRCR